MHSVLKSEVYIGRVGVIMPVLYRKECKICKHMNHFRSTKCIVCKSPLSHSPGRPSGTTASECYDVSQGRPTGTTARLQGGQKGW